MKVWLRISGIPRSTYYEWKSKLDVVNPEELSLIDEIKDIVTKSKQRYGYRRVTQTLKNKGLTINHKRVYRIMKEQGILCDKFHRKSRSYYSYKGKIGKVADNELRRQFDIARPNEVWVTDVTEFRVGEQKLYLSTLMDLYNSEIVSFSTDTRPNTKLTNRSLTEALSKVGPTNNLMIHSDQGFHYQHFSWVNILEENNIKQSMSRKGNCLDNSPMENFFGLLKQEMYYGEKYISINDLKRDITEYIEWYNNKRIKSKLKGLSPVQYRIKSLLENV